MRALLIGIALFFCNPAAAQVPTVGSEDNYIGLLCATEDAGRSLGEAYQLGGQESMNQLATELANQGECTMMTRVVPVVTTARLGTWWHGNAPITLTSAEVIMTKGDFVIYALFADTGM